MKLSFFLVTIMSVLLTSCYASSYMMSTDGGHIGDDPVPDSPGFDTLDTPPSDYIEDPGAVEPDAALDTWMDTPVDTGHDVFDSVADSTPADTTDATDMDWDAFVALIRFNEPGFHDFEVPAGIHSLDVFVWGAGGGGVGALPWGNADGGRGGFIYGSLPVYPGDRFVVFVGAGGYGAACGGSTTGAGGGGHSTLFTSDLSPILSAGGGGGAQMHMSPCHGGGSCSSIPYGAGGIGYGGGGQASDETASDGLPGQDSTGDFAGGTVGEGNCGGTEGFGGLGGGGGGGGTNSNFGGGGGGGGFPGGAGGASGNAGAGGRNFASPEVEVHVISSNGSTGGIAGADGFHGGIVIGY